MSCHTSPVQHTSICVHIQHMPSYMTICDETQQLLTLKSKMLTWGQAMVPMIQTGYGYRVLSNPDHSNQPARKQWGLTPLLHE
jgi:hypothetical protein